jgi:hypothetical protein
MKNEVLNHTEQLQAEPRSTETLAATGGVALLEMAEVIPTYGIVEISNMHDAAGVALINPDFIGHAPPGVYEGMNRKVTLVPDAEQRVSSIDISQDNPFSYLRKIHPRTIEATGLLTQMGFTFEESTVVAIPTPRTIVERASSLGVDISLVRQGSIDSNTYLQTFAEGKYPVSVSSEEYFAHDIEDDHLTAVILGGEALKESLSRVAARALATNSSEKIANATDQIDIFTSALRVVLGDTHTVSEHSGLDLVAFSMRMALHSAQKLGITKKEFDNILDAVVANGAKFGLVPPESTAQGMRDELSHTEHDRSLRRKYETLRND